jgi:hypothetical protein
MFRSCFNTVKSIARSVSVPLPFLGCTSAEIVLLQPRTVLADGLWRADTLRHQFGRCFVLLAHSACPFRDPVALVVSLGTSSQHWMNR